MVGLPKAVNGDSNFISVKHQCLCLLKLCSSLKQLSQIHAQIHIFSLQKDTFLISEVIRFCSLSQSQNLSYAQALLYSSVKNSLCLPPASWNMLIRGYATSNTPKEAIWVFRRMRREQSRPNNLTYPFLLKACTGSFAIKEGKQVHADVFKHGLDCDVYVNNNLVHFYGTCKKILDACKVFDEMCETTVVSWNAIITSCVECSQFGGAVEYFVKMRNSGFEPDETTMVLMLAACAKSGNLGLGRWIHSQVIGKGLVLNYQLGTALVDMYAKSGAVGYAKLVFDRMGEKNVWTWSAMILGLAQHGFAEEGLQLFLEMIKRSNIRPNYVTFLGVLCACSHAGLAAEGFHYFHEMEHKYRIKPMMLHYGALVDLLGRSGRLKEAYDFIMRMPFRPDPIIWRTLLSACSIHCVYDSDGIGDKVRKKLLELEPSRSGNLVMMANMYADAGMWEKAASVRRAMRTIGLKKKGGESCIEVAGSVHRFFSGYDYQDDKEGVYTLLDVLNLHMQMLNL